MLVLFLHVSFCKRGIFDNYYYLKISIIFRFGITGPSHRLNSCGYFINMNQIAEKTSASPRGLLFGLLVNCLFPTRKNEDCPLWELRKNLSIENKYTYVMGLDKKEVESILAKHEACYEKRFPRFWQGNS